MYLFAELETGREGHSVDHSVSGKPTFVISPFGYAPFCRNTLLIFQGGTVDVGCVSSDWSVSDDKDAEI